MSLTLELPLDLETNLRREAARNGVEAETFVRDLIARRLRRDARRRARLTAEEQTLLDSLNAELSLSFWERYRTLQERSTIAALEASEQSELLGLIQQSEAWNVRRLTLLEEFAQKRGMHFPELMQALGIRHHPHAGSA